MLLAEALAARKDALKEVDALRERLAAAAVRYEDQETPVEDPGELVVRLEERLDAFESMSVRINRTNNATLLAFDGRDLTIMEAIALRERLTLEARARHGVVEALEQATGRGSRNRRGWLDARRTKDDVREISTVDIATERRAADGLSETVRRLDIALQQRNWTTDLVD